MMMTNPFTVPCRFTEMPHMSSTFDTMPSSSTPASVPGTEARPPVIAVPPMITAAIASSS